MWGFPISFWQGVVVWMMWAAFVLAALGAAAALISSFVGYKISDLQQSDAGRRIAEAGAIAAKANEAAAKAQERTVAVTLALEKERVERLRLEERVKPRSITPEQVAILEAALRDAPKGTVFIVPDWMDPEAKLFAKQIEDVLTRVGFPVSALNSPDKPLSYGKLGAFLVVRDKHKQPAHLAPLYRAFGRAGFAFDLYEEKYVPDAESVLIGVSTR